MPACKGCGDSGGFRHGQTVSVTWRMYGVVGDGMAGSWGDVNEGSRSGKSAGVHGRRRPEEPGPEGDRASVGAKKRGNARRAKGGRDVEAGELAAGTNHWRSAPSGLFAPGTKSSRPLEEQCLFASGHKEGERKPHFSDNALIQGSGGRSQELSRSISWRAGCGRSASPVRWEGERIVSLSLPYPRRTLIT
jgi:hypothetical protein